MNVPDPSAAIPRRRSDVRCRVIDREAVVIMQDDLEVVILNELGAEILEMIDGRTTVAAILERLAERYEVEREVLEKDVLDYLEELSRTGVLEPTQAG